MKNIFSLEDVLSVVNSKLERNFAPSDFSLRGNIFYTGILVISKFNTLEAFVKMIMMHS